MYIHTIICIMLLITMLDFLYNVTLNFCGHHLMPSLFPKQNQTFINYSDHSRRNSNYAIVKHMRIYVLCACMNNVLMAINQLNPMNCPSRLVHVFCVFVLEFVLVRHTKENH